MRLLALLLLPLVLTGCILMPDPVDSGATPRVADGFVDSATLALEALGEDDDQLASTILLRMRALGPDPETLAWITEVERVLEGRRLLRRLDLRLVTETLEQEGTVSRRLMLRVRTGAGSPVVLHMTPPILSWERDWIAGTGHGGRSSDAVGLDDFVQLELQPDSTVDLPILDLPPARGQAAALRERWHLEMHFCYLEVDGSRYPTNAPYVAPLERYLLASHLQLGPVAPSAAAELLAERPDAPLEAVVERIVRVAPSAQDEALDLLTPVVQDLAPSEVQRIASALLWLTGGARERGEYHGSSGDLAYFLSPEEERPLVEGGRLLDPTLLHGHPQAWQRWLAVRAQLRSQKPASPLDLPDPLRDAAAPGPSQP